LTASSTLAIIKQNMKVFISHSSKDKKFVRKLKNCLNENSISTWFDENQLDLGDSLINKLELALDESSHLVIVLSPSSVESEWVKYELKKAIKNSRTGLMNKIIPIKYRECSIPEELSDLLHADLSKEVVLPEGNEVKFISDGFDPFFLKLVRSLKNTAKTISKTEKTEIITSIKSSQVEIVKHSKTIHRGNYKLVGYTTLESRQKYQKIINLKNKLTSYLDELRPFLLHPSVKKIMNPTIGEKILFKDSNMLDSFGHFAGYRNDDLGITVDRRTRNEIGIINRKFYQIEIDGENKIIRFINEIK